ncbi:MAG: cytochrome c oxidase subunit II [Xanthobacteraceae bacterium]|nr:cytochrome c oxidase subunit II [Xanthobacteraceae bacterium]
MAGCDGRQSALDPAGVGAERIAGLFWWMTGGAAVVWIAVAALTVHAVRALPETFPERRARLLIIGGGALVPTVVLAALLVYGLAMLPDLLARAPVGSLKIAVTGEQWWWRVMYRPPSGGRVESANEIRLPVGEPVEFELESTDVIHSFWIPPLGGKVDMIPGRRTRLVLQPTRTGTFRGVCAEYCGASHALMAFDVVVMEKAEFARWLDLQRRPAAPAGAEAAIGRRHFMANGCSACHTVRGAAGADGVIGPDLTHVGGRLSVGAGTLANDLAGVTAWLERTDRVKPGVGMPHFGMLPPGELRAMAAWLGSLK